MAGRWIALEGGEGSGKSTQAALLAAATGALLTREPGGTSLGADLRRLLLTPTGASDSAPLAARAEALLLVADRAQHVAEIVRPALEAGRHVVSDRSAFSFLAYQGYGRGLPVDELRQLSGWATEGLWPDLAILVDVPPEEAAARLAGAGRVPDRLESAGAGFHERVRQGFAALAAADPGGWAVVDGTGPPDVVAARVRAVWDALAAH